MKPFPAANIAGKTEFERFDNAVRQALNASKEDIFGNSMNFPTVAKLDFRKENPHDSCGFGLHQSRECYSADIVNSRAKAPFKTEQLFRWTKVQLPLLKQGASAKETPSPLLFE